MGSIHEKAGRPGYWELRVALGKGPDGKYRQATRGFRGNKTRAKNALRQFEAELAEDRPAEAERMTFAQLLDRYIADRETRGRAVETLDHYRQQARRLTDALGHLTLNKVGPDELEGFYRHLTKQGRSPSTVARYHALVRAAFNLAVQRRWVTHNPAPATARPTPPKPSLRVPSPEEVRALVEAAKLDDAYHLFVWLAVDTWARPGEIAALRRSHIDLDAGQALIESSLSGSGAVKDTKTHASRVVSLADETRDLLAEYYERRAVEARRVDMVWQPDAFLFSLEPDGSRPWRPNLMSEVFEDIKTAAGVRGVRLYDLRHFGPTQALQQGASIVAVSHRLGHRRISTSLDFYAQWIPASDQPLASLMGSLLTGRPVKLGSLGELPPADPET